MDGELERRIARLRQGDHLCLIYESAAEQTAALVPYFKAGLAAGERCLFVGHGTSCRRLEHSLKEAGVDTRAAHDRGALVCLTQRESWLPGGRFDPGALMDLLRQAEQQALDDGFTGLRATWNMAWVLEGVRLAGRSGALFTCSKVAQIISGWLATEPTTWRPTRPTVTLRIGGPARMLPSEPVESVGTWAAVV